MKAALELSMYERYQNKMGNDGNVDSFSWVWPVRHTPYEYKTCIKWLKLLPNTAGLRAKLEKKFCDYLRDWE
jgi:hypothetical protein